MAVGRVGLRDNKLPLRLDQKGGSASGVKRTCIEDEEDKRQITVRMGPRIGGGAWVCLYTWACGG